MGKRPIVGQADNRPRIWLELANFAHSNELRVIWRIGHNGRPSHAATAGDAVNDALSHIGMVPAVIMWLKQEEFAHGED